MAPFTAFLVFCQALGAVVGACTAVWGELAYARALADGKIDRAERRHLEVIHHGLRFGMSLVLLASLALVVVAYIEEFAPQPGLTVSYWLLVFFALLILAVSWAMAKGVLSFARGSVVAFTAWWFLVYLTLGQLPLASLAATAALFAVSVIVFALVLYIARRLAVGKR